MVALNRISNDAKRSHMTNILKAHEKLVLADALRAGENPDTLDPATYPSPDDCEDPLQIALANRIVAYNSLKTSLESL
jgi:hypothetical protein